MKRIRLYSFLLILAGIVGMASCSKFDRIVKSSDYEMKYTKAKYYYEKENYTNAMTLFDELIPVFKGTDRAEEISYYYAYCNYHLGDFALAAYWFKVFIRNFPQSKHAEECAFLNAYCYYLDSPKYCLDQENTKMAMFEMQEFANRYPESTRMDSCNKIMDELRTKLERKAYEITKQYFVQDYFIDHWKSAIAASNNFVKDFPNSPRCEEIQFINLRSNYLLAKGSIDKKKEERLDDTIESYLKFLDLYPQSKYLREAEDIYTDSKKLKDELKKNSQ